jgi:prophage tail gpP-like protein
MGHVTVRIGGTDYGGWHAVSVLRNLENAASSFSCSVSERTTGAQLEPWVLAPGSPCSILVDGELVITGYIDTYSPRFDARSHGVEIRGRSRTADFIDGAAIVPGGQFKQLSLGEIAQRLAEPFGIQITSAAGLPAPGTTEGPRPYPGFVGPMAPVTPGTPVEGPRPSPDFIGPMPPLHDVQVQQGETCYALLERLARLQGLLITDDAAGNLALTRVGSRLAVASLVQGQNILGASADLDCSQRFSEYTVKGQRANTDDRVDGTDATGASNGTSQSAAGATVRACIGAALDSFVGRYRPWLLTAETQADDVMCQQRAEWEARRRAGGSTRASVVVAGWRQLPNGPLWDVNLLVPVVAPWLGINRVLLISAVEFRKDEGGSSTRLELTLPDAYASASDSVPGGQTASGTASGGGGDLWQGGSIKGVVEKAGGIFL